MKGTNFDAEVDWYEFRSPDDEVIKWRINLNFMMSSWKCLFGDGCPGFFGMESEHTFPDMGCCSKGAYINSREELDVISKRVEMLTTDDISPEGLEYIQKRGWLNIINDDEDEDNPDSIVSKTRIRDDGCVFANRADEGDGKIGCAFVHLGNRLGQPDHIDTMPDVCWQLPIGLRIAYDEEGEYMATEVIPWDSDYWGGVDDDGTHDSWMKYWCVDTPDAYRAEPPLYIRMERELRKLLGTLSYDMLRGHLKVIAPLLERPMPGTVVNGGRPLLPLLVGNRTPKRSSS